MRSGFVIASLLVIGCGDANGPAAVPDRPINLGLEDFVFQGPNGQRIPAQSGRLWLEVEDGSSSQAVSFIRLLAKTETPGPPFIYLAGGPGGSGIATGNGDRFGYFDRLREVADVILYDQRGTGLSTPKLDCNRNFSLPLDRPVDRVEAAALWSQQSGQCAADLRARGVDLSTYNTERNADDIEALRQALGIEKIAVVGYSYGTHLALSYIRRHGQHVSLAILHGLEGPDQTLKLPSNVQRQLETIDSLAEASPRQATITPFLSTLASLFDQLAAKPESVSVNDTLVVFGRFEAEVLLSSGIGDREDVAQLPGFVQVIANVGWDPIGPSILEQKQAFMNTGMSYAMDCGSRATAARISQIATEAPTALLRDAINFPFPEICGGWNVADLGDAFRSPVLSDIPILFVSGSIDGRTPKSNADEVAMGFSNHRHLLIELGGHNELATDPRIADAIVRWVRGEGVIPETIRLPNLTFQTF